MKYLGLFLCVLLLGGAIRHDFHTSLTEMRLNPKEKVIEVSLRVFTDDFELALTNANSGQRVRLESKNQDTPLLEQLIDRYLKQHFVLTAANGQRRTYNYLGRELEVDATWVYLEIPLQEPLQEHQLRGLTLQNDVFCDLFDDQTNLVNVFYSNERKSFLFNQKNKIQTL